jgi:hypothetical protein
MRRLAPWLLLAAMFLGVGLVAEQSWRGARLALPEIGRRQLEPTVGQGVLLGVLGGFRTVVADFTWIRSYVLWERKTDRAGTELLMRAACALDPRSRFFWENAGLTLANDMGHWEIRRRGGYAKVPKEIQDHILRGYARRGLDLMDEGVASTGGNAALLASAALVAELQLKDLALSADYYRRSAEARGAPWFAARFAAANLWKEGRRREAYDWYRAHWLKTLRLEEDGSPDDLRELRDMERELRLPLVARLPLQPWEVAQPGLSTKPADSVTPKPPVGGQSRK